MVLDRAADGAEDRADLAAEEDQGDDRHDRDEGEDQCVLGEPLALLVANEERRDECVQTSHVLFTSFLTKVSRKGRSSGPERPNVERRNRRRQVPNVASLTERTEGYVPTRRLSRTWALRWCA